MLRPWPRVPHPRTERARTALTSVFRWELKQLTHAPRSWPTWVCHEVWLGYIWSRSHGQQSACKFSLKNRYDLKRFENDPSTTPPSGSRAGGDARASMMKRATHMEHMELAPARDNNSEVSACALEHQLHSWLWGGGPWSPTDSCHHFLWGLCFYFDDQV